MNLPTFLMEDAVRLPCPQLRLGCLLSKVEVTPSCPALLDVIENTLQTIRQQVTIETIHSLPALHATREAYKLLGKDPSRYRPSAEALLRRIVQGKGLYQVSNVVDALNLVSAKTGFSIGGYDAEKIMGNIRPGCGEENEPYEAIGRGALNIHGLPILRDAAGAFGSPTSDSVRTMVTGDTRHFLAVFFDFGKNEGLEAAMADLAELLEKYAKGVEISTQLVQIPPSGR